LFAALLIGDGVMSSIPISIIYPGHTRGETGNHNAFAALKADSPVFT